MPMKFTPQTKCIKSVILHVPFNPRINVSANLFYQTFVTEFTFCICRFLLCHFRHHRKGHSIEGIYTLWQNSHAFWLFCSMSFVLGSNRQTNPHICLHRG